MAFTEATLTAQLDPTGQGRTITLERFITDSATITTIYAVGVVAPYAGRSRWMDIAQTNTAAQAATLVQNNLQA
jgi:hypothetical protein